MNQRCNLFKVLWQLSSRTTALKYHINVPVDIPTVKLVAQSCISETCLGWRFRLRNHQHTDNSQNYKKIDEITQKNMLREKISRLRPYLGRADIQAVGWSYQLLNIEIQCFDIGDKQILLLLPYALPPPPPSYFPRLWRALDRLCQRGIFTILFFK